ncbi:MAG: undecaprenyl-diphosphate phosphatase, partial [Spirochaetaceae bacterium]|nr:undecaprenyl-diphosphate phosphatase [Spirochaetaceae bacterium]
MTVLQAILFGCLQGIAEFLPISSSGHLVLLKGFFGLEDVPQLFDVLLHISSLLVILWVFRHRIAGLFAALGRFLMRKRKDGDELTLRLILAIITATFITGIVGLALKNFSAALSARAVAGLLLVTAGILLATRLWTRMAVRPRGEACEGEKKLAAEEAPGPGIRAGIITGLAQGIGVLPGVSRSGITISAALFAGVRRPAAGEFSFLLAVPAILGALLLSLRHTDELTAAVPPGALIAGMASALIASYISLRVLLRIIRGGRL